MATSQSLSFLNTSSVPKEKPKLGSIESQPEFNEVKKTPKIENIKDKQARLEREKREMEKKMKEDKIRDKENQKKT